MFSIHFQAFNWYQSQGHWFESLEPHCREGIVRDFTIRSNTNGLGLRSNVIKDLCPLIRHQLVVGWIGKAHGPTSGIREGTLSVVLILSVILDPSVCYEK